MPNFDSYFKYPLRKIVNVIRYSGYQLTRPETVDRHMVDMMVLALKIVQEFKTLGIEIDEKDLIYRIAIHDLDESTSCDFPRNLKHFDYDILKEINRVTDALFRPHVTAALFEEVKNAKDKGTLEGRIIKFLDVFQCCCILKTEIYLLGNKTVQEVYDNASALLYDIVITHGLFSKDDTRVKCYIEELFMDFYNTRSEI